MPDNIRSCGQVPKKQAETLRRTGRTAGRLLWLDRRRDPVRVRRRAETIAFGCGTPAREYRVRIAGSHLGPMYNQLMEEKLLVIRVSNEAGSQLLVVVEVKRERE